MNKIHRTITGFFALGIIFLVACTQSTGSDTAVDPTESITVTEEKTTLETHINDGCLTDGSLLQDTAGRICYVVDNVKFYGDFTYEYQDGTNQGKWTCTQEVAKNSPNSQAPAETQQAPAETQQAPQQETRTTQTCRGCNSSFNGLGYNFRKNSNDEVNIYEGLLEDPYGNPVEPGKNYPGYYDSRKCAKEAANSGQKNSVWD